MRKDITIETITFGGEKLNKSALARQYGCCWETIDRRLNPDKYKTERKIRIYKSILDPYKNIIDEKLENNNIPATGIYFLLKEKYEYNGKYGIVRKYVSEKKFKKEVIKEIRRETTYRDAGYGDDDMTGDVEYLIEYIVCPLCGHKKQKDKWRLRIIREYDRSGNVYNR